MSYNHPILVPGAKGHDDPVALREVIENLVTTAQQVGELLDRIEDLEDHLDDAKTALDEIVDMAEEIVHTAKAHR